jgi:hypothetical protein
MATLVALTYQQLWTYRPRIRAQHRERTDLEHYSNIPSTNQWRTLTGHIPISL